VPTAKIIRILSEESGVPVTDVDRMVEQKESAYLANLEAIRPMERVVAIASAHRGRLPLAVASGGYRETVTRTLDRLGIRFWFDAMVVAEDTPRHKPEPDVFLEAARRLGLAPDACVVFEDTDIGIEAAKRGGMMSVDVRDWLR
jgi:HAD superfamily hydrolase (TIGR01509 family)